MRMLAMVLLVGSLGAATPVAADDEPTEAALHAGLKDASGLLHAEDWSGAKAKLLGLVETHGEQDYSLLSAHRILEGLKQCAFWSDNVVPPVEDLMAGEILSYDKRSGKIKIRYRRDEEAYKRWKAERDEDDDSEEYMRDIFSLLGISSAVGSGDFSYWDGVPMHPIHFSGPYTVEVKGRMPPEEAKSAAIFATPQMVVRCGDEGTYSIRYGYPKHGGTGWYSTPNLVHTRGGKSVVMDEDEDTPLKLGGLYSVKVNVSKSSITATANGKSVVKCKKQGKTYGQFGFRGCPNVEELILNGEANIAWLEGLTDSWVQENLTAFDQEYDPRDELPEGFVERLGEEAEAKGMLEEFPGGFHPKHPRHLEALEKNLSRGRFKSMLSYLTSLKETSASTGFRDYLSVQCQWRLGQLDEALEGCRKVRAEFPDYAPAALTEAQILNRLARDDDAGACLEDFIAAHPEEPSSRVLLTSMLMAQGRFEEAQQSMRDAIAADVPAAELSTSAFMLTRAQEGPDWAASFEHSSRNYIVRSDMSQKICIETSKTLEQSLSMYKRLFGQPDKSADGHELFEVFLFSGRAGYHAYTRDLFASAATATAGVYSPVLKQLIIWNLPDHDELVNTIRHEGFHQYIDSLLEVDPPTWFNEGTASYMETAQLKRSKMTPGAPVMSFVFQLTGKGADWMDLDELLTALPSAFYGDASSFYAQSWAVVHTLLEGGRDQRKIYERYLDALLDGQTAAVAFERAFEGQSLTSLHRAVQDHVRSLKAEN